MLLTAKKQFNEGLWDAITEMIESSREQSCNIGCDPPPGYLQTFCTSLWEINSTIKQQIGNKPTKLLIRCLLNLLIHINRDGHSAVGDDARVMIRMAFHWTVLDWNWDNSPQLNQFRVWNNYNFYQAWSFAVHKLIIKFYVAFLSGSNRPVLPVGMCYFKPI